jgi:hypothetical protein
MEYDPPGRRRARRSFLLPFAAVLVLATIGSSAGRRRGAGPHDRAAHSRLRGRQVYSASVVKLFTMVHILHRTEADGLVLTPVQQADIPRALSLGDDNAMHALWNQFGGSRTVIEMIGLANLRDTRPPANPGEWGETLNSARDVVGCTSTC